MPTEEPDVVAERDMYRGRSLILAALLYRATGEAYEWLDARVAEGLMKLNSLKDFTKTVADATTAAT